MQSKRQCLWISASLSVAIGCGSFSSDENLASSPVELGVPLFSSDVIQVASRFGDGEVQFSWVERALTPDASAGAEQHIWRSFESVSFRVDWVAARGPHEVYVFGHEPAGPSVIQRWELEPVPGSYVASRAVATTEIGAPWTTGDMQLSVHPNNGAYTPPALREEAAFQRTSIYRGDGLGRTRSATIDPDGRYLLVLNTAGELHQLELRTTASPASTMLLQPSQSPELSGGVQLFLRQDSAGKRVCVVHPSDAEPGQDFVVLLDSTNDGSFESVEVLSSSDYFQRYFSADGTALWTDDFLTYTFEQ